jgi:hypothetical protein
VASTTTRRRVEKTAPPGRRSRPEVHVRPAMPVV